MKMLRPKNAACLIATVTMLQLLTTLPASAQEKPPTTQSTPTGSSPGTGQTPPPVPAPTISAIQPGIPFDIPNETLTVTGSNFQDGVAVTLEDPRGHSVSIPEEQIISISATNIVMTATLDAAGKWKIKATNPKGAPSSPLEFSVAAYPAINPASPAVKFYRWSFWVVTGSLAVLFLVVVVSLLVYMIKGQWSLGDALSEESSMQPREIRSRADVITVASSSRLIALSGCWEF